MKQQILFHGRHILHTVFQEETLRRLVTDDSEKITQVIFAVTSSNHANSRYNPVPFHYRAIGIDRFASRVLSPLGVHWSIVPIPHLPPTQKFVARIAAYIQATHGYTTTPENTHVLCSTPALITQFREMGFSIDTAEYDEPSKAFNTATPQALLSQFAKELSEWKSNRELLQHLSPATVALWETYPEIPLEIERLWNETLLTEGGDITETRDYGTYTFSMSRNEVIDMKYQDIKEGIVPGVVVDEGCADGALLARIAKDFPDSDLIGIEITREYIAQANERQRRGDFGNSFTFFYQRNLGNKIFADNSVDTTICNSTTHEIWSYAGGDEALQKYLAYKYAQLKPGGALLIRDVIGPENGEEEILAWFNSENGVTPDPQSAKDIPVAELSSLGRFYRFAQEFFNGRGVEYQEIDLKGRHYVRLKRKDAADFLSKKEYVDNWDSELHEDFTHWSFSQWKKELETIGFTVDESQSRSYANDWITENFHTGTAELYRQQNTALVPEAFPPTNVILIARK